ncbi:hypothetical protein CY34DRAFT_85979 [Suillus luteus UH-Slu-Lm8-n1]|uniref:Uncharacterized protein n=1 Tax=Suillus luteus UH-Slu-Lm8-n1 TaxID=930992 RepID=A0A0D0AH29_9AGAM|nr:hypothetical protein CY34DRAFT_85979 [Suillus luteus UH-Slu-Lm8-n1]
MAYVAQQQLDGYDATVQHAIRRKATFDKRVLARSPREVIFEKGQLIQFFHSNLHNTLEARRKLLPKWSGPHRIRERLRNSYHLETLEGEEMPGEFHARRLRAFIPRNGTRLAEEQKEREARKSNNEEVEERDDEDGDISEKGEDEDEMYNQDKESLSLEDEEEASHNEEREDG